MRWVFLGWLVANLAVFGILGQRGQINGNRPLMLVPDMDFQPRYNAQSESPFFPDGRTMRVPPAGTVAYGGLDYYSDSGRPTQRDNFLRVDKVFYEGVTKEGGYVANNPGFAKLGLDTEAKRLAFLEQGRDRYTIYCAVCHGAGGNGRGVTTRYGLVGVANYHDTRLLTMPDGQIYQTITQGKGNMMPYGHQVKPEDRWAIVAYIRALQLANRAVLPTQSAGAQVGNAGEKTQP